MKEEKKEISSRAWNRSAQQNLFATKLAESFERRLTIDTEYKEGTGLICTFQIQLAQIGRAHV